MTTLTYYMLDRSLIWELIERHDLVPVVALLLFALVLGVQDPKAGRWTGHVTDLTVRVKARKGTIHEALAQLAALDLIAVERPFSANGKTPASILVLCFGALVRAPAGDEWGVAPILGVPKPHPDEVRSSQTVPLEFPNGIQTRENADNTTTDSLEAVGAGAVPAPSPTAYEFTDDALRYGQAALARAQARGDAIRDTYAYVRAVARRYEPPKPKAPKGASKRPEQSGTAGNRKLRLARAEHMSAKVVVEENWSGQVVQVVYDDDAPPAGAKVLYLKWSEWQSNMAGDEHYRITPEGDVCPGSEDPLTSRLA